MANVLSQDEVDSLLDGISDGAVQTESDTSDSGEEIEKYDFSRQAGPLQSRMPGLTIINERLTGFLRTSLSNITRSVVDVNLISNESVKFGEFCNSLPLPASLNIFKMEPLKGYSILVIEGPLVFSFVDTFFGGMGSSHVKLEGRGFTTIETKIIEKVVKITLEDIQKAWADIYKIKTVYIRSEMEPKFASIVAPEDVVMAMRFMLDLGNTSGSITICIPYFNIEPAKKILREKFQGEKVEVDQTWRRFLGKKIKETTVNLGCILGMTKISGRDLMELKNNDVIPLDQKIGDPIILNVEGIPKFEGLPGSYKNYKAMRITKKITESK